VNDELAAGVSFGEVAHRLRDLVEGDHAA